MNPRTTYREVLGSVVGRLRKNAGVGQMECAHLVGFAHSSNWSRIERGQYPMSVEQLARVARRLGIPPGRILELTDAAVNDLQRRGVAVHWDESPTPVDDSSVAIGAAALGAVIGALVAAAATTRK